MSPKLSQRTSQEELQWRRLDEREYAPIRIGVDAKNNVNLNSYTTTLIC